MQPGDPLEAEPGVPLGDQAGRPVAASRSAANWRIVSRSRKRGRTARPRPAASTAPRGRPGCRRHRRRRRHGRGAARSNGPANTDSRGSTPARPGRAGRRTTGSSPGSCGAARRRSAGRRRGGEAGRRAAPAARSRSGGWSARPPVRSRAAPRRAGGRSPRPCAGWPWRRTLADTAEARSLNSSTPGPAGSSGADGDQPLVPVAEPEPFPGRREHPHVRQPSAMAWASAGGPVDDVLAVVEDEQRRAGPAGPARSTRRGSGRSSP